MKTHFTKQTPKIFNSQAPFRKRYIQANQVPCMNDILSKGLKKRYRLRNK